MPDYRVDYTSGNTFRFTDLIHDDYFKAIRTLFNAKLYVSCSKLLMSCVDTLAFVEYGDDPGNFTKWVDIYVDLTPNGIAPRTTTNLIPRTKRHDPVIKGTKALFWFSCPPASGGP